jgi:hypothetical protein
VSIPAHRSAMSSPPQGSAGDDPGDTTDRFPDHREVATSGGAAPSGTLGTSRLVDIRRSRWVVASGITESA